MAVTFEFEVGKGFHFTTSFAENFNLEVEGDRVNLPDELGEGFIQEVYLDNGIALCLHHYNLQQDFILRRRLSSHTEGLTIKFDCRRSPENPLFQSGSGYEVEFGTGNFFSELVLPAGPSVNFLVIGLTRNVMLNMIQPEEDSYIANTIRDNESFVLHEAMTTEMERVLKQLSAINHRTRLAPLLYKTRAQELIYLLFSKLITRDVKSSVNIKQADAEKIYKVRAAILSDLSQAPVLQQLSATSGINLTKMKELFRQIFGESIYNYYQAARMSHAADLLNDNTVSEAGHQVGFTNLSHFTRLFEKHHKIKPKRYKDKLEMAANRNKPPNRRR
ncbi:MAG: AraC family transcriptional regulator [Chryseolinea sp.]